MSGHSFDCQGTERGLLTLTVGRPNFQVFRLSSLKLPGTVRRRQTRLHNEYSSVRGWPERKRNLTPHWTTRSRSWSEKFDASAALALNRSEKESGNLTIVHDYYLFYKCSGRQVVIQQKCRGTPWASTRYFVTGLDSTAALEEKVDDTRQRVC